MAVSQLSTLHIQYSRPPVSVQQTSRFSTATHHFTFYTLHFPSGSFCESPRPTCPTCPTIAPRNTILLVMERFVLGMDRMAFLHGAFFRPPWSGCLFDSLVLEIHRLVSQSDRRVLLSKRRRTPAPLGEAKPLVGAHPHPRKGSQPTPQGHRRHASRATQKSVQGRCPTPAEKIANPSREERPSRQVAADLLSRWLYLPFVCFDDAVMEISRQNGKYLIFCRGKCLKWENPLIEKLWRFQAICPNFPLGKFPWEIGFSAFPIFPRLI